RTRPTSRRPAMPATEVTVPDIGGFSDVPIIEVHVKEGDQVNPEDPLITLESDKATMDVPAPSAGTVSGLRVSVGDRVSAGSPVLLLDPGDGALTQPPSLADQQEPEATPPVPSPPLAAAAAPTSQVTAAPPAGGAADFAGVHAGPGVRRAARELGVDLTTLAGTGPKGRITKEDLLASLRGPSAPAPAAQGGGIPPIPAQDFS